MFGFEAVHRVIVHGVELLLPQPVEKTHGQQLEHYMDKARVEPVNRQAIVGNLTDDPGTAASAQVHLQE